MHLQEKLGAAAAIINSFFPRGFICPMTCYYDDDSQNIMEQLIFSCHATFGQEEQLESIESQFAFDVMEFGLNTFAACFPALTTTTGSNTTTAPLYPARHFSSRLLLPRVSNFCDDYGNMWPRKACHTIFTKLRRHETDSRQHT